MGAAQTTNCSRGIHISVYKGPLQIVCEYDWLPSWITVCLTKLMHIELQHYAVLIAVTYPTALVTSFIALQRSGSTCNNNQKI